MQDFFEAQFKCIHIPLTLEVPQGFLDYSENTPSTSFVHTSSWWESVLLICDAAFHRLWDISTSWVLEVVFGNAIIKKTNDDT